MALKYTPRTREGRDLLRAVTELEADAMLLAELRRHAKNDSGTRLSEFGRKLVIAASDAGLKQGLIASLLEITPGAVSRQVNR